MEDPVLDLLAITKKLESDFFSKPDFDMVKDELKANEIHAVRMTDAVEILEDLLVQIETDDHEANILEFEENNKRSLREVL
jgi:hypothetical protein